MDDKAAWLLRVLGVSVEGEASVSPLTEATLREGWLERIKEMASDSKRFKDPEVIDALAKLAEAATRASEGNDLVAAELAVDALEIAVAQAARARSDKQVGEELSRAGLVSYRKAQIKWTASCKLARDNLLALAGKISTDPEVLEHPQRDEVLTLVGQAVRLLPEFDDELFDLMDELDQQNDPDHRRPLLQRALAKIAQYRGLLSASEGLEALQSLADDEYGGMRIYSELDAALQAMKDFLER